MSDPSIVAATTSSSSSAAASSSPAAAAAAAASGASAPKRSAPATAGASSHHKRPKWHKGHKGGRGAHHASDGAGERDIRDVVTPLWKTPYPAQLQTKLSGIHSRLAAFLSEARAASPDLSWPLAQGDLPCPLLGIVPAPNPFYYRNKCEFTIGMGSDKQITVGFNAGRYVDGDLSVKAPDECLNVPEVSKFICRKFSELCRSQPWTTFDKPTHMGFWRMLTVRTACSTRQAMLIVQVQSQHTSVEELATAKAAVVSWFNTLGYAWPSFLPASHPMHPHALVSDGLDDYGRGVCLWYVRVCICVSLPMIKCRCVDAFISQRFTG
jgi:hypothetical protein